MFTSVAQGSKTGGNPEYEEIRDWVPAPALEPMGRKSDGNRGRGGPSTRGGARTIEGAQNFTAVLSDSSDNGEGDDYVDMKSFLPSNQSFTPAPDNSKFQKCTLRSE